MGKGNIIVRILKGVKILLAFISVVQ